MSRTKLVVVSLLAAFAISAVASSSALATHEFLVNGSTIAKGSTVEYGGNQQQWQPQFETTIATLPAHIQCQWFLIPYGATNVLEERGKYKEKIEFRGCTVFVISEGKPEGQPKCKVAPITAEGGGSLSEAGVLSTTGSKPETTFAEIKIEEVAGAGACALKGEFKVKGTQLCPIWHYPFPYPVANINCNGAGSKELTLGGEPAKLSLEAGIAGKAGQTFSSN